MAESLPSTVVQGNRTDAQPSTLTTIASTVADAMIEAPKMCAQTATVGDLRRLFADDHVHAALFAKDGILLAVVDRSDLDTSLPNDAAASTLGELHGRVVTGTASLDETRRQMLATGRRRLAVTDDAGRLIGLLCLKRTRSGFCSDQDVHARATERLGGKGANATAMRS